jgi:putative ABC transport system substrate-binding protein
MVDLTYHLLPTPVAHDFHRHAAEYVDPILWGKKPVDLPVQAPNRFELVVNLKAAKAALAWAVPTGLLIGAEEVSEWWRCLLPA